jgi:integrase
MPRHSPRAVSPRQASATPSPRFARSWQRQFENGLIRSNPAATLRVAQRVSQEDEVGAKALTEAQLRTLLGEIPVEHRLFFELLAQTGLRIGEAVALTWADLDLGKRRLTVRRRIYRGRFDAPKSKYGRRTIPLSRGLSQALWRLRGAALDDAPVFASRDGTHLDASNLAARVLKPAARRAGVGWVGFHTFRHTCATMLFRNGLNAKQVQMWLGHHSPAFTLATYIHLLPDDLPDIDLLDVFTGWAEEPHPTHELADIRLANASDDGGPYGDDHLLSVTQVTA